MSSLVLLNSSIESLYVHYKACLDGLVRLYKKTPSTVVLFLAGSLPAPAMLHISMFSLLNIIIRLEKNPLNIMAWHSLNASPSPRNSWFTYIQELCVKYSLPSALTKMLLKRKVLDFWVKKLC